MKTLTVLATTLLLAACSSPATTESDVKSAYEVDKHPERSYVYQPIEHYELVLTTKADEQISTLSAVAPIGVETSASESFKKGPETHSAEVTFLVESIGNGKVSVMVEFTKDSVALSDASNDTTNITVKTSVVFDKSQLSPQSCKDIANNSVSTVELCIKPLTNDTAQTSTTNGFIGALAEYVDHGIRLEEAKL